ncbi:hypothetical protein DE146DRAFT_733229 [Phaeosphaeria sp. MPI-PUGE-AT-0046c]|nr:hypothetical protein DE146DRAFT_733229 [Phaeosphaeria sp. MPI-PUGE-AT-0046c]
MANGYAPKTLTNGVSVHKSESVQEKDYELSVGEEATVAYEKSPYADANIVSLIIGRDATPFSIHSTFLVQSAVLAGKLKPGSKQRVSIPELDKPTAHTLVHYLYTGDYEDLRTSSIGTNITSTYAASTCVYCAAVRYELPGLAELAKAKIKSFDQQVSISDVLAMARDHVFPLLPEGETWYPSYLETAIQNAMVKDPEPFQRPEFITQIEGNSRILQIVWKTVMGHYMHSPLSVKTRDNMVSSILTGETDNGKSAGLRESEELEHYSNLDKQPPASVDGSQTTAVANDAPVDLPSPGMLSEATPMYVASIEGSLSLDEIEPTLSTHKTLEPFTDELGYERSKVYQTMGNKDVEVDAQFKQDGKLDGTMKVRADSVTELAASVKEIEQVAKGAAEAETGDKVEGSPTIETASLGKKANKKKEKKKKSGTVF